MNPHQLKKNDSNRSESIHPRVMVIGLKSVGKSSLLSLLTGCLPQSSALAGTTLHCEHYQEGVWKWIDTPGIVTNSDAVSVREALNFIESASIILLVLRAHSARAELEKLLPVVGSKSLFIVCNHKDSLNFNHSKQEQVFVSRWRKTLGLPVILLDARSANPADLFRIRSATKRANPLVLKNFSDLPDFPQKKISSSRLVFERLFVIPLLSLPLLLGPTCLGVNLANFVADRFYDLVYARLKPALRWFDSLPSPIAATFGGDYGIVAMFPFLLLYAMPTILVFTTLIAIYKSTGLLDRLSYSLHPWLRPFGLGGRELVRVVMGLGCNVPAIAASRSCSSCSRGACVSAICFGSACSYQLPAALAVFSASGFPGLGAVYVVVLALTTLIYLRFTMPKTSLISQKRDPQLPTGPLQLPDWATVFRESIQSMRDFLTMAIPIFIAMCFVAGMLQWSGALEWLMRFLEPVMAIFNLPPEAALAVVLGSVRKDGLAIGMLNSDWTSLKAPLETPIQILTAVYLASVLLPCLVTVLAVAREMHINFTLRMVGRQACFATLFSLCIAWGGWFLLVIKPS